MPTAVRVHHDGRRPTGLTKAGESWADAARRIGHGEVWPLDLSGEVKVFTREEWPWVAMRPMLRVDLPDVARWRGLDHVRRWYDDGAPPTIARLEAVYGPRIDGEDPTAVWIVEANGRSVGFCQDYLLRDHPEFSMATPDPDAIGIDYAIGEPAFVGRGLGLRVVWALVRGVRARHPEAEHVFAAPDHRNQASLRVLEECGFVAGDWFDEPVSAGPPATMVGCTLAVRRVLG